MGPTSRKNHAYGIMNAVHVGKRLKDRPLCGSDGYHTLGVYLVFGIAFLNFYFDVMLM